MKVKENKAMNFNYVKSAIVAVTSAISAALGILYVPVLLMVVCNIIDYITGLMASVNRSEGISSYKSMKGIMKKVAMWLLVVVGAIVDHLIIYCTDVVGIDLHINFIVAAVVAVWITCNELISILENLVDIGVKIPDFLMKIVVNLESQINKRAGDYDEDKSK